MASKRVLNQAQLHADQLRRNLVSVIQQAQDALARMEQGKHFSAYGDNTVINSSALSNVTDSATALHTVFQLLDSEDEKAIARILMGAEWDI